LQLCRTRALRSGVHRACAYSLQPAQIPRTRVQKDGIALKNMSENPERIFPLLLDVSKDDDFARVVPVVTKACGERGLKGLFTNAGIGGDPSCSGKALDFSIEGAEISAAANVMNVNYLGTLRAIKAFLPLLRKGKGAVALNASVAGFISMPFMSQYCASKHAVEALGDSLRREQAKNGVRVTVVECAFIATKIFTRGYEVFESSGFKYGFGDLHPEQESFWLTFYRDCLSNMRKPSAQPQTVAVAIERVFGEAAPPARILLGAGAVLPKLFATLLPYKVVDFLLSKSPALEPEKGRDVVHKLVQQLKSSQIPGLL